MSNRRRAYRRTTSRRAPAKRGGGISKINLKNVKRPAIFKASFWDKKRIIIAASAAAAIILAIVLICVFTAKEVDPSKVSDEELYKMKYKNGISIEGIDVSGMVFTDAAELVGEKANDILGSLLMRYCVYPCLLCAYHILVAVAHHDVLFFAGSWIVFKNLMYYIGFFATDGIDRKAADDFKVLV